MATRIAPEKTQRIYELIAAAAERGERCPSNAALTAVIGARSNASAAIAVQQLVREGALVIVRRAKPRVVEIAATGNRTAGKPVRPHEPRGETKQQMESRRAGEREATRMDIAARAAADQARRRAQRDHWLTVEQQKYALPTRARPIEEMPA